MSEHEQKLRQIWTQDSNPVIYRQGEGKPMLIRLPFHQSNFHWLKDNRRSNPKWDNKYKCWKAPTSWFDDTVERTLARFGMTYVIQHYREHQKCASACWNAHGFHCECSCMGLNHGSGHPGGNWNEVSETFAVNWGQKKYTCRLLSLK